jgi:uncharacterized membrane protein YfcA
LSWGDVIAVAVGLVAGLLSGTIGVGGGLIFVPVMTAGYGLTQTLAQGTSLAAIVPTALVGGITHYRQGNVVRDGALWMGAAGVGGAVLGALVAVHVPALILARVFAAFLIVNSFLLLRRALTASPKTPSAPI